MDKNSLTEGVIWRKLLGFFFPILGGMLFQQLYNTADAIIVGKCVGTNALAAVGGSSFVIINLVIGVFGGLASGATVVISQYYGAKDRDNLSLTVHTAIAFCIVVGLALTVVCYLLAPLAIAILNTPSEIAPSSVSYLRIYFVGTIPMLIFNIGSGILRAVGDSKRPLYYLVVSCLLNIGLDLLFVKTFALGVNGAAWATVISVNLSALLIIISMMITKGPHKLSLRKIRFNRTALKKTLHIGVPSGVQSAMYSISNLVIQAAVNSFGTVVVAAWAAISKFDGVYWVTSNSFGLAICAFVGQCFGAGLIDRMKRGVRICLAIAAGTSVVMSVTLLSLSRFGMGLLSNDPAVIQCGVQLLYYFAPFYVIWSVVEIMSNTLRGVGDSVLPMLIVILGVCVLRVLWVIFVVPVWHTIMGVSMSYAITWTVTAIAMVIYYKKSKWIERCSRLA